MKRKIKETFGDDLKSQIPVEFSKLNLFKDGTEAMKSMNDMTRDLSEEDDQEEYCDGCDSVKSKCVCKQEPNEATGAGSAGGFEPLFSATKKQITDVSKVEAKEATGSSSAGIYDAPGFEDVKMRGNHHRGSGRSYKKTQIPGGKFVSVKKKCKKFPYCNQGDIKALTLTNEEVISNVIDVVCEKYGLTKKELSIILDIELKNRK